MLLILFPWNMIRNAFSLWQQVVWWESSISSQLICGHGYTMKLFEEGEKREGSVYLSNLPPSSKKKPQVVSGCKKERRGTVTTCQLWLKQQPVFVIFSLCICVFLLLLCSLYLSYFYLGIFAYFLKYLLLVNIVHNAVICNVERIWSVCLSCKLVRWRDFAQYAEWVRSNNLLLKVTSVALKQIFRGNRCFEWNRYSEVVRSNNLLFLKVTSDVRETDMGCQGGKECAEVLTSVKHFYLKL